MRQLARYIALAFLFCGYCFAVLVPAVAQSPSKFDLGGGYQYVHTNAPPGGCGCFALNGGNGWFAYNVTPSFGTVAEIGVQHASNVMDSGMDLTLTSFLAGPRYSLRKWKRFTPFGQVLLGISHASGSFAPGSLSYPGSSTVFAMATGGGLDIAVSRHISVRTIQADYYLTNFDNGVNEHQNNLRIGAGIVYSFGREK